MPLNVKAYLHLKDDVNKLQEVAYNSEACFGDPVSSHQQWRNFTNGLFEKKNKKRREGRDADIKMDLTSSDDDNPIQSNTFNSKYTCISLTLLCA